jgi:hypothetical protein
MRFSPALKPAASRSCRSSTPTGRTAPTTRSRRPSGLIRPLAELQPFDAALVVEKHRHSALVGTGLAIWLHQHGIRRLIVAGIRTEQCCETTTRHASDEGWEVDYVTEATLTFAMQTPAGATLTPAAIRERTETVLAGPFCDDLYGRRGARAGCLSRHDRRAVRRTARQPAAGSCGPGRGFSAGEPAARGARSAAGVSACASSARTTPRLLRWA